MGISDEDADDVEDEDEVVEEPPRKRNKLQATLSFGGKVLGGKATKSKRQGSENAKKEGARNADAFTYKAGIKESLPPMHDIVDIFDDLTKNAVRLGLKDAVEHLGSHKLRVATMCSGTESPILALDLIGESLQKLFGLKFRVDHQFSAEIVPYKQAYIERNFAPPLIFRDIRELIDSTTATTAYGAVADVPGDIDLLVAGFSCVDFSNLNTKKQTLDAGGESGDTFRSVFNYAKTWRPALIILENVCSAPWEKLREAWAGADYDARFFKLDTKHYYIPHTRQRGYMVCIDREKLKASGKAAERWTELVQSLKRPASSSIEAFLLHEDDPRVHRGRAEMSRRDHGEDKGPREVDWTKCQGRHQDYRADLFLGSKRPMTGWEDNGSARMPDYAWGDWGAQQVERIWDTFEISFLRNVRRGFDSSYKTRVWELSQNIDRFTDTTPFGITGCITPTGYPYITNRGGPMVGLEALSMQGLPIEKLLLTRESNKQLQDLAGNAMTSTVVGAAMMAALTVGHKAIKISDDKDPDVMDIDSKEDVSKHLCGEEHLHTQPLDLGHVEDRPIDAVLADAARSARLCLCEGRALMTSNRLRRCKLCHHTTCEECGGTPSHAYEVISSREIKLRIAPGAFEDQLKNALPMRVMLAGIAANSLEALKDKSGVSVDRKDWSLFKSAITPALGVDFRFHSLKRAGSWTAYYDSPTSRMELALNTRQAEWRIFAKPDPMEPGNSRVRDLLLRPFARMKPAGKSLIEGEWQICLPVLHTFRVKIQGLGSLQRSWESKQGLQEPQFADKKVWSCIQVTADQTSLSRLDMDIAGEYDLLPDCGTASGSLHKKRADAEAMPLFLFLDPTRLGNSDEDCFVFSPDIRRLSYGETRTIVATLQCDWCPSDLEKSEDIDCNIDGQWVECPSARFEVTSSCVDATFAAPPAQVAPDFLPESCAAASTVLACKVPLPSEETTGWKKGDWVEVTKLNEGTVYASFAWLTERVRVIHGLDVWKPLALDDKASSCRLCAPTAPQVRWKVEKQKLIPYEDSTQAAPYEHALKNRPPPFVTQVRIDDDNVGMLRIGLNVWSLVHRSIASLPKKGPEIDAAVSWRLSTNYVPPPRVVLPQLTLRSNKNDRPSRQPPNFLLKLRPEQLRSVHWMISQEAEDVAPFVEEEVEEALLPQLGWRAEARATKAVTSRGGVLADQVGYGKTATTLGLIDIQFEKEKANPLPSLKGKIAIKASLIIVPNTLVDQWRNEVLKFLGRGYNVVCVKTQIALAALTIKDFQNADIIITTWPIFNNETYLGKLASLAALPEMPSTSGRAFDAWYAYALTRVQGHVDVLREDGASTLREVLKATLDSTERDDELSSHVPSKRLRGAAYQAAKAGGKENDKPGNKRGQADRKSSTKGPKTAPKGGVDPFSLSGKAARGRWTEMKCPLFQMFHFNRVVVDEYTYVAGKDHTCTVNLSANARWVLSGTPPLEDFADIKSISVFLGINLGVDDDAAGFIKAKTIKTMQKERTAVEKFQAFKTVRSPAWHERRHEVAQLFLDQFVRQNIAEIDEIPFKEHLRPVVLPAAERAIYLELHSHLMSQDMKIRQGKTRADSDRVKRLTETLGASKTAEEALLKRCSHFTLEDLTSKRENAKQACDLVVVERRRQLAELEAELQKNLRHAAWLKFVCGDSDKHYDGWKKNVSGNTFGDKPATEALIKYINTAEAESKPRDEDEFYKKTGLVPGPEQKKAALQAKKVKAKKALERKRAAKKRAFDSDESEAIETEEDDEEENQDLRAIKLVTPSQHVQALRDLAGQLRRLATELIARRRSLRFFKVVRELQLEYSALRRGDAEAKTFGCPVCGKDGFPPSELAVLTICGHTACPGCDPRKENNDACSVDGCNAAARGFSIVRAAELGEEDLNARVGRHYGKKLQEVVHLIGAEIPEDEQVLLFVQYDDLMEKVSQALTDNGISNIALTDRNKKYSSALMSSFQSERGHDKKKVLVLNVANESASGANLTNANHIIFLSPFLLGSQYHYDASTTQAIGRARRYGQKKLVHIYRFLSLKTIDVDILESRTKKKLEKVGDGFELVERSSGEDGKEGEGKAETWGGGLLKNQSLGDD